MYPVDPIALVVLPPPVEQGARDPQLSADRADIAQGLRSGNRRAVLLDAAGHDPADAGNLRQPLTRVLVAFQCLVDAGVQHGEIGVGLVEPAEVVTRENTITRSAERDAVAYSGS